MQQAYKHTYAASRQFNINLISNVNPLLPNNLRDHFKSKYQRPTSEHLPKNKNKDIIFSFELND